LSKELGSIVYVGLFCSLKALKTLFSVSLDCQSVAV